MILRTLALPALLVGALSLVAADVAEASHGPERSPRVRAGFQVDIGLGHGAPAAPFRHGVARGRRFVWVGGYWTYETQRVWRPARMLGYDRYGYPIYSRGHYKSVLVRVWVPRRRVLRRPFRRGVVIGGHVDGRSMHFGARGGGRQLDVDIVAPGPRRGPREPEPARGPRGRR